MNEGQCKGYFCWGMNPCHSAPNAKNVRNAMANLDWLMVADWVITESASFWQASDMDASAIDTTVYFLPAALIYEKPGLIANSGRWLQYRYQACEPWDEAKPDYEICDLLWREIVRLYEEEKDDPNTANPDPILNMKWDYYVDGKIHPRPVAMALNGYKWEGADLANTDVELLSGYSDLAADGSTACAIHKDEQTDFVTVDESKCTGCKYCSMACPFDVPRSACSCSSRRWPTPWAAR